ncbi:glycoside hydrolase family 16 protein [Pseudarthrobacter albicanus]|uniref:glycoside hydrolase family 16 protein n=1 Tax=Pseudarthrobacter albicanus TaxID=2823873 RepID=UPI001FE46631|nr:glycoside hydrolase family 16 protein [Pseudarthrobacter albicanus]
MRKPDQGRAVRTSSRLLRRFLHILVPPVVLVLVGCGVGMAGPADQRVPLSPAPDSTQGGDTPGAQPAGVEPPSAGVSDGPASPASPQSAAADLKQSGDLPGWKQVFEEDFSAGDVPLGAFPGELYGTRWSAGYKDGTPDTAGQVSGGRSGYYPSKVLSVKDGALDWYLHSENGISMGAAPQPRIPNASANPPRHNSLLYGRYSVRFKADSLAGFKTAWLMWPDSGVWPRDGEIDFPEGDLAGVIYGAVHYPRPDGSDAFVKGESAAYYSSWHVATMEWSPGRVEFFLDGQSISASTTAPPTTPMHLILQTESCLTGCPLPETQGHVSLDWISIWTPA